MINTTSKVTIFASCKGVVYRSCCNALFPDIGKGEYLITLTYKLKFIMGYLRIN